MADLMKRSVRVELCGATAKAHNWGNADLLPGIKVNTDAMARTTQLVQQGFREDYGISARGRLACDLRRVFQLEQVKIQWPMLGRKRECYPLNYYVSATSAHGPKRPVVGGQSMSALPGKFRRLLVLLSRARRRPQFPNIEQCFRFWCAPEEAVRLSSCQCAGR